MTGSTMFCHSPQPPAGNQFNVTANSSTNNGAATNLGIASPSPANNINARSIHCPARSAANTPSGMPISKATNKASPPMSSDTGSARAINWLTV